MELTDVHDAVLEMIAELLQEGADPFAVAGVMSNIAFSMYKTTLSESDFNLMMDFISQNREKVLRMDASPLAVH
jgi:hypothetical protein